MPLVLIRAVIIVYKGLRLSRQLFIVQEVATFPAVCCQRGGMFLPISGDFQPKQTRSSAKIQEPRALGSASDLSGATRG